MLELKMLQNESFPEFVVRVLNESDNKQETYKYLFDKELAKDECRKRSYLAQDIQNAVEQGRDKLFVSNTDVVEIPKSEDLNSFYKSEETIKAENEKEDLLYSKINKLEKTIIGLRDENTFLRKFRREDVRDINSTELILKDILSHVKDDPNVVPIKTNHTYVTNMKKSIILHISDVHYSYSDEIEDFLVESYISEVEKNIEGVSPSEIVWAFTGDLTSHHKYAKKYTNIYTKGEGITKCSKMLGRIMLYFLNKYPYAKHKACSVVGNESDFNEAFVNDAKGGFDNSDYLIYQILKSKFEDRIEFLNEGNDVIYMLNIQDKNIILNHGYHQMNMSNRKNIEDFFHKLQNVMYKETGIEANLCLTSHIHQAMSINGRIYRNGAWEGSNSYSKYALGIADTYRTQNMIVIQDGVHYNRLIEF